MTSLPPPPPPPPNSGPAAATCYRHPNRPAYRRCTRCDRLTCDECLTPGSIGSLCPECIRSTQLPTATRARHFYATRLALLWTYALIVVNVILYIWVQTTDLVPPTGYKQGEIDMGLNRFFIDDGEWWRIVTSGFLHFSVIHIGMNMLSLYFLGKLLEPTLPKGLFMLLYAASLLAGSAGVILLESRASLTGGASGAIFGLLGATAVGLRHRGIGLMQSGLGFTLIMNLVITFTIPNISIGGHLGGLAGGAICGYAMLAPRGKFPPWAAYVTPVLVGAAAVIICLVGSANSIPG